MDYFGHKVDQPFHTITLLPVPHPSVAQIRVVRSLGLDKESNYPQLRALLQAGGFQMFGLLFLDRANEISKELFTVGIPHRVDPSPLPRMLPSAENQ